MSHRITDCHRAGKTGRHLWGLSSLTPCWEQVHQSKLHRSVPWKVLGISKDGIYTACLGSLFQCLTSSHSKKVLFYCKMKFPVFQFVPIASCPVTGHHWEESDSVFFSPPIRCLYTCIRPPWAFFAPCWTVPALSASPRMTDAPIP